MWSLNSRPSQSRSILRWCSIGCAATFSLLASNDMFALPPLVEIKPEDCLLGFTFPPYAKATYHAAV